MTIDNNLSERTLRQQAVGRKNWLFLGSEAAGPRAAVLSTIIAGAKRHRIEPWYYVRDLLFRLHADDLCLEEMLPDRWAAAHPEAILNHRLEESRAKRSAPALAAPIANDPSPSPPTTMDEAVAYWEKSRLTQCLGGMAYLPIKLIRQAA